MSKVPKLSIITTRLKPPGTFVILEGSAMYPDWNKLVQEMRAVKAGNKPVTNCIRGQILTKMTKGRDKALSNNGGSGGFYDFNAGGQLTINSWTRERAGQDCCAWQTLKQSLLYLILNTNNSVLDTTLPFSLLIFVLHN